MPAAPHPRPTPFEPATAPTAAAVPFASEAQRGTFAASLGHAWRGLLAACLQRNFRLHLLAAAGVGWVGSALSPGLTETVVLLLCVMLVLFAELVNSALETLVDLYTEKFHELAGRAKDLAAAAVLLLSLGSTLIFAAFCVRVWPTTAEALSVLQERVLVGLPALLCSGALLFGRHRRAAVDHLAFAGGLGSTGALAIAAHRIAFPAVVAAVLVMAWRVAAQRRRLFDESVAR